MVSVWGCEQRLVLGQIAADAKSNEITAVLKPLEMLSLKGCNVTAGALNCQLGIASQIAGQGGDYALALKGNQGAPNNIRTPLHFWTIQRPRRSPPCLSAPLSAERLGQAVRAHLAVDDPRV